VRSAQTAVFALLGLDKKVSPLYKAQYDPKVLFGATKTLLRA
jgi:oleate hydratase